MDTLAACMILFFKVVSRRCSPDCQKVLVLPTKQRRSSLWPVHCTMRVTMT